MYNEMNGTEQVCVIYIVRGREANREKKKLASNVSLTLFWLFIIGSISVRKKKEYFFLGPTRHSWLSYYRCIYDIKRKIYQYTTIKE